MSLGGTTGMQHLRGVLGKKETATLYLISLVCGSAEESSSANAVDQPTVTLWVRLKNPIQTQARAPEEAQGTRKSTIAIPYQPSCHFSCA